MYRKIAILSLLGACTFGGVAALVSAQQPTTTVGVINGQKIPGVVVQDHKEHLGYRRLDLHPDSLDLERGQIKVSPVPGHISFQAIVDIWRGSSMRPHKQPARNAYHVRAEVYDHEAPDTPLVVAVKGPFAVPFTPGQALSHQKVVQFDLGPFPKRPDKYTVKAYLMDGTEPAEPNKGFNGNGRNYASREQWYATVN